MRLQRTLEVLRSRLVLKLQWWGCTLQESESLSGVQVQWIFMAAFDLQYAARVRLGSEVDASARCFPQKHPGPQEPQDFFQISSY